MSIKYKTHKKRNGINNKELYYPVPVKAGVISTRDIAEYMAGRSSLTAGDIRATLIGLAEVIQIFLKQGYNVKLDDLGSFSISATADGFKTPEECMPQRVRVNKLCFLADPHLKKELKKMEFERYHSDKK